MVSNMYWLMRRFFMPIYIDCMSIRIPDGSIPCKQDVISETDFVSTRNEPILTASKIISKREIAITTNGKAFCKVRPSIKSNCSILQP